MIVVAGDAAAGLDNPLADFDIAATGDCVGLRLLDGGERFVEIFCSGLSPDWK